MAIREENRWINKRKRLIEYQIRFFEREIRAEEKRLAYLESTQDARRKAYGLEYDSLEEINQAYAAGIITSAERYRQRSHLWQVFSDRDALMRLEWLRSERDKYKEHHDALLAIIEKKSEEREARHKALVRKQTKAWAKRKRAEARAEREAKEKEEQKKREEKLKAEAKARSGRK